MDFCLSQSIFLLSLALADGCPNRCNGNGQCLLGQNSWHCECKTGWRGTGCNVAMETSCADNKDNEGGERSFVYSLGTLCQRLYVIRTATCAEELLLCVISGAAAVCNFFVFYIIPKGITQKY